MTPATKRSGDNCKETDFCILVKLKRYKLILEYYNFRMLSIIPRLTTKKKIYGIYTKENEKGI